MKLLENHHRHLVSAGQIRTCNEVSLKCRALSEIALVLVAKNKSLLDDALELMGLCSKDERNGMFAEWGGR